VVPLLVLLTTGVTVGTVAVVVALTESVVVGIGGGATTTDGAGVVVVVGTVLEEGRLPAILESTAVFGSTRARTKAEGQASRKAK
jgi:ribosomal protein L18E